MSDKLLKALLGSSTGIGSLLSPERKAAILTKFRKETREETIKQLPDINKGLLDANRGVDYIEAGHINHLLKGWIAEVGQWAYRNFGDNNGLGRIGPFLGIIEECGEFVDATTMTAADEPITNEQSEAMSDAMADKWIYLFDFCNRAGVEIVVTQDALLDVIVEDRVRSCGLLDKECHSCVNMTFLGQLAHVNLKLAQGIRGIDPITFKARCSEIVTKLFLHDLNMTSFHLCGFIEATWAKVRTRDWKANPVDAHKHEQAEPGKGTNETFANVGDGKE